VILAEVSPVTELIAGGGVTGMLVIVMTAMLRRTKETDERTDEFSKRIVSSAAEREAKAWAERDEAQAEVTRLRQQLEEERRAWREERAQWPPSRPAERSSPPDPE
jgi:hypothetical protein